MSYVELKDVYKRYKMGEVTITASNGVNFEIEKGEFAVIVGSSGAGKTTILNILGGMDTLSTGKVYLDGQEISALNKKQLTNYRRHDVGFVFQFYNKNVQKGVLLPICEQQNLQHHISVIQVQLLYFCLKFFLF